MLLLPSALALCRIAVTKSKEHTPGERMRFIRPQDTQAAQVLSISIYWVLILWQMSSFTQQFYVTGHFYSLPNYLKNYRCVGKSADYFSLHLALSLISPKMFLKYVIPSCFFLWVQIQLYIANAIFLGSTMNFFCCIADLGIYTWEFCQLWLSLCAVL